MTNIDSWAAKLTISATNGDCPTIVVVSNTLIDFKGVPPPKILILLLYYL